MINYRVSAGKTISGDIQVDGDKSISHRAVMLGSVASGITEIHNYLSGEDTLATVKAFASMGVKIEKTKDKLTVHGLAPNKLNSPPDIISLGNSGTAMRLMIGLCSGLNLSVTLVGDESLNSRPMLRVSEPLNSRGAKIQTSLKGLPPVTIKQGASLKPLSYLLPIASAQIKSAILLSGLFAKVKTEVIEPNITRDHTENMLKAFSYPITITRAELGNKIVIDGTSELKATSITVPNDYSSAAFFIVAGVIAKEGTIKIRNVGINPTRNGLIPILQKMGANIKLENITEYGNEPVADIIVGASNLKGIEIDENLIPIVIDELPILCIAAASATGETKITGASELRVKESDRIHATTQMLRNLGVDVDELADGWIIKGAGKTFSPNGKPIESFGDHRIAMSGIVASICSDKYLLVKDCENIKTSFPNFISICKLLNFKLQQQP